MATIKPSEHLELIIHRLGAFKDLCSLGTSDIKDFDERILGELERLHSYLRETGQ